jgi:hypothetical protein
VTQQIINVGSAPNDSTGDPMRTAWIKANGNFTELYGAPVRVDIPQSLTDTQQTQGRSNVYAAPFDALAYNGMQINGGMEVSQEKAASGTTVNGSYPCDNWRLYFVGTMVVTAAQTSNIVPGFARSLGVSVQTPEVSLGASDVAQIYQPIEGYRVARLAWGTVNAQPITLGFWTSHHRPGLYSGTVLNSASNRCYAFTYTQSAADVGQYNVVTIPGDTAGVWATDNTVGMSVVFALAAGSSATASSANTWLAGNYSAAPGQVNAVAATSDSFRLTGLVVLPGIEAPSAARSPFIMRSFDQELLLCRRYWQCTNSQVPKGGGSGSLMGNTYTVGTNAIFGSWKFDPMRAQPTLSIWCNGVQNQVRNDFNGAYLAATLTATSVLTPDRLSGVIFSGAPLTLNTGYSFDLQLDARL